MILSNIFNIFKSWKFNNFLITCCCDIWVLFRPITKKELDRYNDKDNWSNMGF